MKAAKIPTLSFVIRDLSAGLVVFVIALPLCLGIAVASNAQPFYGLVAGVIGGVVVGLLSGSQTSVSGPAAGLTAVVAAQIASLGSYQAFLLAVVLAGVVQIILALARVGFLALFIPSSVIKGLLAAIGIILILKQIPHVVGHDPDPEGDMSFLQYDDQTTFSELGLLDDFQWGATLVGLASLAVLLLWDNVKLLKKSVVPGPLVVVIMGVMLKGILDNWGESWSIESAHLVNIPVAKDMAHFFTFFTGPDFSHWYRPAIWTAALTLAAVASLETLLNIEAVDKLDPGRRTTPANRELLAQGIGNVITGLLGGLPLTSVVARSSVNINAGNKSKLSTIVHGFMLLVSILFLSKYMNMIPISCLAAILLMTGLKLANPALIKEMWSGGRHQFLPFLATVIAIVFTDLLIGVVIGIVISVAFILASNVHRPLRLMIEKHIGGDVLRIELANQVSFLNRGALAAALDKIPSGGRVLIDAANTNYIDLDVLSLIREFKNEKAPLRGVEVSLTGFRTEYKIGNEILYVDYTTREMQQAISPEQVLHILKEGNLRFRSGQRLTRNYSRQVAATAAGQHPLAVILGCIDSRAPAELIFDLGVGDVFSVRVAGNVPSGKIVASIEYACAVAGAKLLVVLGHTRCGAVTAAVDLMGTTTVVAEATGCQHLEMVIGDIQKSIDPEAYRAIESQSTVDREQFINTVARQNVLRTTEVILRQSETLHKLVDEKRIAVLGAIYDVTSGDIDFFPPQTHELGQRAEKMIYAGNSADGAVRVAEQ